MKREALKRIAALLVCGAMLLSGLGIADEVDETQVPAADAVVTSTESTAEAPKAPVEQAPAASTADEAPAAGADATDGQNNVDEAPAAGADSTDGQSNVDETADAGAESPDDQSEVDETADADAESPDDQSDVDGTADPSAAPTAAPSAAPTEEVKDDEDPDAVPDSGTEQEIVTDTPIEETDDGLLSEEEGSADDGIMLMIAEPDTCADGHQFVDDEFKRESGVYSCDASGHTMTYEIIQAKKCEVCGFYDPDSYKVVGTEKVESKGHDWDNYGICAVCGYECQHPGAEVTDKHVVWFDEEDDPYWAYSETQHIHAGNLRWTYTCPICGDGFGSEYYEELEDHKWENNVCTVCDYEKPEEDHVHVWVEGEIPGGTYEAEADRWEPSPEGCVGYGLHVEYGRQCECGAYQVFLKDVPGPVVVPHKTSDGQSICERCGYHVNCAHEHKSVYDIEQQDVLLSGTLHDNGNGTHSGKYVQLVTYGCLDCNYEWTETQVVDGIQACYFGDRGTDTCICGAKHTQHVWSGNEADIESDGWSDSDDVTAVDEKGHRYASYTIESYKVCTICGAHFDEEQVEYKDYFEPHFFEDGETRCDICGYTTECEHDLEARRVRVMDSSIKDSENHSITYRLFYYCTKCDAMMGANEDVRPREETVVEPHTWGANGLCTVCGAVKPCEHEKADRTKPIGTPTKSYAEIAGDDLQHDVIVTGTYKCPTCLKTFTETTTEKGEHHYKDGVCTDEGCGHVCAHSQADQTANPAEVKVLSCTSVDDKSHTITEDVYYNCPCGGQLVKHVVDEEQPHNYEDGKCLVAGCEHVCAHSNKVPGTPETIYGDKPVAVDDDFHSTGYTVKTPWTCPDCKLTGTDTKDFPTGEPVAHNYVKQGDEYVCSDCGHKCEHTGVTPSATSSTTYPVRDEKTHTATTTTTTTIHCTHGHADITKTETTTGTAEAHSFVDGVCAVCGYECAHGEKDTDVDVKRNVSYKSNGSKNHTVTYDLCDEIYCTICGEIQESIPTQEGLSEVEAHSFKGSKCTLCGYTKPSTPAATATPAPTVTPMPTVTPTPVPTEQPAATVEPLFEEVTPEEPVHGVTADSSTRMGTALGTAVTEIEKEYGESVQLNIQNAEKVLPAQEYATFEALPAQEQIMVLVAVLSGESEAENGVSELGMTLSGDAEQLIVNLQSWMQNMTADESAAFMELVKEYFTVEGEDDHLVITLEIKTESGTRYERYGFDLVDGAWVFQKLEVAEIPAAA